jgi:hypothetical protein
MMIAVIMLMRTISPTPRLPSSVTIHNQCSYTELISPIYFGNGAICPKLSGQQMDVNTKMSVCFDIYIIQDDFESALLLELQRYFDSQYSMDTLTTETNETIHVYMLVAWKVKDSKFFVYVALIEHNKELTWSEDKLKKLYNENCNRLMECNDTMLDTWLVGDNIALKTTFSARNLKGALELNISISEEKRNDYAIRPLRVDLEK